MSDWIHINGSIRLDDLLGRIMTPAYKPCLADWLRLIKEGAPDGSEGGLDWITWENPEKSALAAYSICFFGDLRDRGADYIDEIRQWLRAVLERKLETPGVMLATQGKGAGMIFRSFVVEAHVNFHGRYVFWVTMSEASHTLNEHFFKEED